MDHKEHLTSLWIAAGNKATEREYWLEKLAGKLRKSSFPSTYEIEKKPGEPSLPLTGKLNFRFSKEASSGLVKIGTGSDVRLYILLNAVLVLLLGKYTGDNDIIISAPILKSNTHKNNGEELINKVLILRNLLTDQMTFKELLLQVRQTIIEADKHQNYPLEVLLKQLNLSAPPFDVAILVENIHDRQYLARLEPTIIFSFLRTHSVIEGQVEYSTSSYHHRTVKKLIDHYQHLAELVLDNPEIKVADVELLLAQEKKQLLFDFNHPEEGFPTDKTIPELFEKQVEEIPTKAAVVSRDAGEKSIVLTYRELDQSADHLARLLVERGIKPDAIAALMVERSVEMIVGILGILKAGAVYLPLNPKNPAERNLFMLKDCSVRLLLTSRSLFKESRGPGGWEGEHIFIEESGFGPGVPAASRQDWHWPLATSRRLPATSLAYIIYTSGSTGQPKGVPITHANFSPLVHWGYHHLGICSTDRVIQNLPYYFDWSVWEIFITLTSGAALYVITDEILLNPQAEVDFILENQITALHITPTQYQYLVNVGKGLAGLKYLFIGAEKLTLDLVKRSFESVDDKCRIFNMYGPTEATIISAVLEIDRTRLEEYQPLSSVPIGETVANTTLLVLDTHLKMCPIGVAGELYIGGGGVSRGYLNNPELTEEKFAALDSYRHLALHTNDRILPAAAYNSPFNSPLYKTGDRVR